MTNLTLASAGPIVTIKGDRAFANSRDVAEFFEKRHDNVVADIRRLFAADPETILNFQEGSYTLTQTGSQRHRCFDMDQEGFTLLAMGFTGAKALHFKRLYIRAFNAAMEEIQKLRSQAPALPNFANPADAARAWASEYEQKVIAQQKAAEVEQKLIEAQPKLAVADMVQSDRRTLMRVVRTFEGATPRRSRVTLAASVTPSLVNCRRVARSTGLRAMGALPVSAVHLLRNGSQTVGDRAS